MHQTPGSLPTGISAVELRALRDTPVRAPEQGPGPGTAEPPGYARRSMLGGSALGVGVGDGRDR